MAHKFNVKQAANLDKAERLQQLPPYPILYDAGLTAGMTVVDIGCGGGFFTLPAAEIVGSHGKVLALDISTTMLQRLKQKNPPAHVLLIHSMEDIFPVASATIDFLVLAFVIHEAEDPAIFLREIRRLLQLPGKLLLIDFEKIEEEKGPPKSERIAKEDAIDLLIEAGFDIDKVTKLTLSHYQIIAKSR